MLDYKILKLGYAVSYGSVTLKSLQNDCIPELDLLVREAIQNSSDASLQEPYDRFKVNFNAGKFQPKKFNAFMSGLDSELNSRFPEETASFLEIRDSKTCGLTGNLHISNVKGEDHGNFFKLIYDTGKRQLQTSAGGNWGFGKSVYYRVGIGIVIFYSQVKTDEGYESRLIVTLVEDENKKNPDGSDATLLQKLEPDAVGKAWWGKKAEDEILPITDPESIDEILDVFNLKRFGKTETGTSVIIPYIDQEKLLEDIIPHEAEVSEDIAPTFVSSYGQSIEDYLRLSIQKWYAPKIHNQSLTDIGEGKKWLHVSVNNKPIRKQDMLPFFQLVQELYNSSLSKISGVEYIPKVNYEILTKSVNLRSKSFSSGSTAGFVAVAKVSKQQLYGDNDMYLSPYVYCGKFEAEGGKNEPMVMYTRDPGMIIEYTVAGPWVKNIPWPESEDDFIFAFFVPDTKKVLAQDLQVLEHAGKTLGEYLRSCEASDHMGWTDPARMTIVSRIQKNTVKQIVDLQTPTEQVTVDATASRLSGKLGKLLLPLVGYEKKKTTGGGSGSSGGGKARNLAFEITSQKLVNGDLIVDFRIKMAHAKRDVSVLIAVDSEGGSIDPKAWQRDISTPFPAEFVSVEVSKISSSELGYKALSISCSPSAESATSDFVDVTLERAENAEQFSSFSISSHIIGAEITGTMRIHARDKRYSFSFRAI